MVAETVQVAPQTALNPPKRRARRITMQDAEAIAEQVSKRLTETEACYNLDIEPKRWWLFKQRHGVVPKFEALCTRMRAAKIQDCIDKVDKCGNGEGMKQPDWRAKAFLLQVIAPERFNMNIQQSTPDQSRSTLLADFAKALAVCMQSLQPKQAQVIDVTPVKQIENSTAKTD
jgi:hypothetical protein